ncbi:hypothetical protein HH212_26905 (plasmid) [Massilia forsythiae]|uniref:Uncharacterized protein n=1 Tax=Massilia forsythiae TaxID=2728020 RepID=A0A7Z2ZX27_9BURK|nr:hypothetical protein [Massilia forsythiae]QJE03732.1 hypothetical protein HH212_26905 [Massilia forsythiae]
MNNRTSHPMKKQPLDYFRNDHWLVRLVVLLIDRLTSPTLVTVVARTLMKVFTWPTI